MMDEVEPLGGKLGVEGGSSCRVLLMSVTDREGNSWGERTRQKVKTIECHSSKRWSHGVEGMQSRVDQANAG